MNESVRPSSKRVASKADFAGTATVQFRGGSTPTVRVQPGSIFRCVLRLPREPGSQRTKPATTSIAFTLLLKIA
ncbi:MAG: hypothetical protein DMG97_14595 [Acidobacteria bacterium]|nr:MAG: hypothetical protein DMG97_14595 [Acidobacteriota bacterium]